MNEDNGKTKDNNASELEKSTATEPTSIQKSKERKAVGCVLFLIGFPVIWIVSWTIAFRVSDIADRSSDDSRTDLSGVYRLSVTEREGRFHVPINPLFPTWDIANNSDIVIRKGDEDTLLVGSQSKRGESATEEVSLSDSQFYWREGSLKYFRFNPHQSGIFPGLVRQSRSGTISKDETGNLHISTVGHEKGLILYFIPFWKEFNRYELELKAFGSRTDS